jgi:outer membrane lipoprotein-sorting protein
MSIIIGLLLVLVPQGPNVNDLVDGVVRTYSRMNDFSAEFEQTTKDSSNQTRTYRGLLYLKSGRRMVFQQNPPGESWYSDGKTATEFTPAVNQARQRPLKKAENEIFSLFQIPWSPELKKQFPRSEVPNASPVTPGHRLVRLIPEKTKDLPVILLEVDPATHLIHRFVTTTPDGATNEFRFKNLKTTPLDKALFEFKPPPGVQVIREK